MNSCNEINRIRAYRTGAILEVTDHISIQPMLHRYARKTASSVRLDFFGKPEEITADLKQGALLISNHRDIIMDASWLTMLLRDKMDIRPYMAIGNNLFGKWWIEPFMRFNRAFVVIRDGAIKDQIRHSTVLSQYIRDRIHHKHCVWIAQREGRAKDGNDRTQTSVLKMLALGQSNIFQALHDLNICPVSISYEYDPCDYLKAQEMQQKRDNPNWKKSKQDDITSMSTGINGWKGNVVFRLTPSINNWLDSHKAELETMSRNDFLHAVCHRIDWQIHRAYEIFKRDESFEDYLRTQLEKVNISDKDIVFLNEKIHEMYINPVKNHEASCIPGEF